MDTHVPGQVNGHLRKMYDDFETLLVSSPEPCVLHVQINRPLKKNAMNTKFWVEFRECFERIAEDSNFRAVVLSGVGEVWGRICGSCTAFAELYRSIM